MARNHADDASADRPFAGYGKRLTFLVCGAFVLGVAVTALTLWLSAFVQGDMPMSDAVIVAALLGGGLSTGLAAGLMAAVFHSNRSGWDKEIK